MCKVHKALPHPQNKCMYYQASCSEFIEDITILVSYINNNPSEYRLYSQLNIYIIGDDMTQMMYVFTNNHCGVYQYIVLVHSSIIITRSLTITLPDRTKNEPKSD